MPMRSESQRRAMHAAAAGKSTLKIPKSVGKEFVKSDPGGKLPKRKKMAGGGPAGGIRQDQFIDDPNLPGTEHFIQQKGRSRGA